MRLTVKPVRGERVVVDACGTVAELRAAVYAVRPEWQASHMRLVCDGKVLADADPLDESTVCVPYIVAMLTRPQKRIAAIETGGRAHASNKSEPAVAPAVAAPPSGSGPSGRPATPPTEAGSAGVGTAPSDAPLASPSPTLIVDGDDNENDSAEGGVEGGGSGVAVTGAPRSLDPRLARLAARLGDRLRETRAREVASSLAADTGRMGALARTPEVRRLLSMPELHHVLSSPPLLARLLEAMLLQPTLQSAVRERTATAEMVLEAIRSPRGDAAHGAPDVDVGGHPGGAAALTADDRAAVARLTALGFGDARTATEAYLACERDENAAANLLLEMAGARD